MPSNQIQWFPGHMAKTRRMITENLSNVDIVIELLDARIPKSSKNPEINKLIGLKPKLVLLTKSALADPDETKRWVKYYSSKNGWAAIAVDTISGDGIRAIYPAVRSILSEKLEKYAEKGMDGRRIRAMIVGIPNVGKSSLVNKLSGGKKAKVENRPGVTLTKQWVPTTIGIDLLDMPGVLWPKFDDRVTGENLAFTGAIKDAILDTEELACALCDRLYKQAPVRFCARYKLDADALSSVMPYDILCAVAKKRGFLVSGGELDTERAANMLLEEFRDAKIGRITLESAPDTKEAEKTEHKDTGAVEENA